MQDVDAHHRTGAMFTPLVCVNYDNSNVTRAGTMQAITRVVKTKWRSELLVRPSYAHHPRVLLCARSRRTSSTIGR